MWIAWLHHKYTCTTLWTDYTLYPISVKLVTNAIITKYITKYFTTLHATGYDWWFSIAEWFVSKYYNYIKDNRIRITCQICCQKIFSTTCCFLFCFIFRYNWKTVLRFGWIPWKKLSVKLYITVYAGWLLIWKMVYLLKNWHTR